MAEQKPMQRVLLVPGWEDVKRGQLFHAIHEPKPTMLSATRLKIDGGPEQGQLR